MQDLLRQLELEKSREWPPRFDEPKPEPKPEPEVKSNLKTPYEEGAADRLAGIAEPQPLYAPGTEEYTQYAEGYCRAKPLFVPHHLKTTL